VKARPSAGLFFIVREPARPRASHRRFLQQHAEGGAAVDDRRAAQIEIFLRLRDRALSSGAMDFPAPGLRQGARFFTTTK